MRRTAEWLGTLCPGASLTHGDGEAVLRRGPASVTLRPASDRGQDDDAEPFEMFVERLAAAIEAHDVGARARAVEATLRHARARLEATVLAQSATVLLVAGPQGAAALNVPALTIAWWGVSEDSAAQDAVWELVLGHEHIHMKLTLEEAEAVAATLSAP